MEVFLGTIQAVGFNFPPRGWMPCDGRVISISQYTALFALLGTQFGGDGQVTFGLPDLRGRVAVGMGQGPGLTPVTIGGKFGTETVTLSANNMPAHVHPATSVMTVGNTAGTISTPVAGNSLTKIVDINTDPASGYSTSTPTVALHTDTVKTTVAPNTGGSMPISVQQPSLGVNYIICLEGIFPSRN
jgi:microcystin-dependent protein